MMCGHATYLLRIASDVLQELLDHLEGMLSNEAVVVTVGQAIVEVKPQVADTPMRCCCAFPVRHAVLQGCTCSQPACAPC